MDPSPSRLLDVALCCAIVACVSIPGASSQPEKEEVPNISRCQNPVVIALSCVSQYDIYQAPVIVQTVYSSNRDLTVLFLPDNEAARKDRERKSADWEIRVIFPYASPKQAPRAIVRNAPKIAKSKRDTWKLTLGKAVAVAASCLDWESILHLPTIIHAAGPNNGGSAYPVGSPWHKM